jgi:hypothetical protein
MALGRADLASPLPGADSDRRGGHPPLALLQSRSDRAAQGRSDQKPPDPVVHGMAGGLPGHYQVGWGEGGV